MRVLEKAGFTREGVLHRSVYKDKQWADEVVFARTSTQTGPAGTSPAPVV
jgi:RimJ/RimL family protein N-acetyltransferase